MPAPKDPEKYKEWKAKIAAVNKIAWTDGEDSILREYYSSLDTEELCKLLPNRTVNAINGRARRLKIYKIEHHQPSEELAHLEKFCTQCQQSKPLGQFGYDRRAQRYRAACKACHNIYSNTYYAQGIRQKRIELFVSKTSKQCAKCLQILPFTEFYKAEFGRGGVHSQCKACRATYAKRNYQENRETRVKQRSQYRLRSRAKEKVRANRRRARKNSVTGTHTAEQIQEQLKRQHYRCYYAACGFAKFEKRNGKYIYHIDHTFPLSRVAGTDIPANSIDYLVLTCPRCNDSKGNKFPWEWPEGGRLL